MKPIELANETVVVDAFKTESMVNIGNKRYLIKRHFLGKRGLTEAVNTIVKNEAVRKTV